MDSWLDKNFGTELPSLLKMDEIWLVNSQENYLNCCHQMSDFKAKMHQIRFRLGLRPRPHWGSLQRSPEPLAGFYGSTSNGRKTGEKKEKKVEGEGKGKREGSPWASASKK